MALLWIEGFEGFGAATTSVLTNTSMVAKYPTNVLTSGDTIATGRTTGTKCLKGVASYIRTPTLTSASTIVIGLAVKFDSTTSVSSTFSTICNMYEGTTLHTQLALYLTGGNVFCKVLRNGTLLGTGTIAMVISTWYFIEVKIVVHSTTGAVTTRVNEVQDIAITNQNTRNGGTGVIDNVLFSLASTSTLSNSWSGTSQSRYMDDIYICDTTGVNNTTFLGDCIIEGLTPSGAGSNAAFTPTSGSNYAAVNEYPYTTTLDNRTNTATAQDSYAYTDLAKISGNIKGIQINSIVSKTDATAQLVTNTVYRSSTASQSSQYTVPQTSYSLFASIFETDPIASAAWTVANVNSSQFGLQKV